MCDPGIPLPKMEVTFSMQRLSRIEEECKQYMAEVQRMHQQLQEQREIQVSTLGLSLVAFLPFGAKELILVVEA